MTTAPFDTVAARYDQTFTERPLGRWLRAAVWEQLEAAFAPGDHVLELGCGTGEDAVRLAQHGVCVHATDQSEAMIDVARRKAALQGLTDRITFAKLDLASLDALEADSPYDGGFSNFGVLNSLPDRRPTATALARWIRPGGRVVLVVMGPLCPWEWMWYLARGHPRTAFRRFCSGVIARLDEGTTMRVWYPSPRRLRKDFAPYFRVRRTAGIGVVLPPSFASHLVDRWPRFFARLSLLDRRLGRFFPGTWLNDHYLMILERTDQPVIDYPSVPPNTK
ncbi:MAG: class I SAM-dependent methyltransferase [Rhodothermales bacterium]